MPSLTRRSFLKFLGIAPVAVKLAPFISTVEPPVDYIVQALPDSIFKPSPMLTPEMLQAAYSSVVFGYDEPEMIYTDISTYHKLCKLTPCIKTQV